MAILLSMLMLFSSCSNKDSDLSPDGKNTEQNGENDEEKSTSSLGLSQTSFIFLTDGETTEVYIDGIAHKTKLNGVIQNKECNLNQDEYLVTTRDTNGTNRYYVTKKNVTLVTSEPTTAIRMAAEGGKVYYTNDNYELYLFDGDKSTKIDSNVNGEEVAISPNGKAILYNNNDNELYLYANNKITNLGINCYPCGLSDDCKYMYVTKTDEDSNETPLYTINSKGETSKISSDASYCAFNRDCTEVLFESDGNTYMSIKGAEKVKLFSYELSEIVTTYTISGDICSLKSFIGTYCTAVASNGASRVYKIDKEGNCTMIKSNAYFPQISADGKTLVYLKVVNYSSQSVSLCAEKVGSDDYVKICDELNFSTINMPFAVSSDFSYIYYLNDDDSLYYSDIKGEKKTKIADDVDDIAGMMQNGKLFYIDDDDTLCSYDGKNTKKIAEDVEGFYISGSKAYYKTDRKNNTYSYYYTSDGENFTFLKSGVSDSRYID